MDFKIEKKLDGALGRAGVIRTAHGAIHTPAFVPVGTKATVKALTPEQVRDLGAEIVLANTYHLYLQPGDELVREAGGLHKFMNWNGPIITDSGGFQVFSLGAAYGKEISKVTKITDPSLLIPERFDDSNAPRLAKIGQDGVSFKSHLDGSIHYITPERSIEIQHNLGADIIFAFDECTSPAEDFRYQEEALERTHRWAERSLKAHSAILSEHASFFQRKTSFVLGATQSRDKPLTAPSSAPAEVPQEQLNTPALFGIVQGGREQALREKSAKFIGGLGFDGFGIGGSFAKEDMSSAVAWVNAILPESKPRHLLGIGEPEDLFMGIENGVDLFDCVAPTRNARNGTLYTSRGKINIMNERFKNDFGPIDEACGCYVCGAGISSPSLSSAAPASRPQGFAVARPSDSMPAPAHNPLGRNIPAPQYTLAYLAHLFRGKEMLGPTLASIHNLYFIVNLVKGIRESILNGDFHRFKAEFFDNYSQ